jgi:hypothetical protein
LDLQAWLNGEPGHAKLDFELGGAFTRMLVGNERLDSSDMQVTHSNFDYERQPTDMLESRQQAFMHVPACGNTKLKLLVYPDMYPGDYRILLSGFEHGLTKHNLVYWNAPKSQTLVFTRINGPMPTRLVTALELQECTERIPGECSLGVLTDLQPKKRLWWGSVAAPQVAKSYIVIHDLPEVYGGIPEDEELHLSLHSAAEKRPVTTILQANRLIDFTNGVCIEDIWPNSRDHLCNQPGYYTMFCGYGGLTVYTLTKNAHGSVCLEHGF